MANFEFTSTTSGFFLATTAVALLLTTTAYFSYKQLNNRGEKASKKKNSNANSNNSQEPQKSNTSTVTSSFHSILSSTPTTTNESSSRSSQSTISTKPTPLKPEKGRNTTSNDYKGYKITADGRKTTYFNRELSVEDKQLVGDCTPKRISVESTPQQTTSSSSSSSPRLQTSSSSSSSQWNAAGTWEEKDYTTWAKKKIRDSVTSIEHTITGGSSGSSNKGVVAVTRVSEIDGDAAVVMSRGKRKYIYDFSFEVSWKATFRDRSVIEGKFIVSDVTSQCQYDIKSSIPSYNLMMAESTKKMVDDNILSSHNGIKKIIINTLDDFLVQFQALH